MCTIHCAPLTYKWRCVELAYCINEDCISCGACSGECPVSCIAEGKEKYVIDASQCIECGACADVCPVDAPKKAE